MKLKLDENLGERGRNVLAAAGHDVCTVPQQGLESALDQDLLARCAAEGRALVTMDLDFANPLVYPPATHAGVAVLRLPKNQLVRILSRWSRPWQRRCVAIRSIESCGSSNWAECGSIRRSALGHVALDAAYAYQRF